MKFETIGIAFRQNPQAPQLFSFVASSNELKKICGVARKSEKLLTNYQRALDEDRVIKEVAPFFRDPKNSSPTAIVLSIHESPKVKVDFVDIADGNGLGVDLKKITIEMEDVDSLSNEEVIASAIEFLDSRLSSDTDSENINQSGVVANDGAQNDAKSEQDDTDEEEEEEDSSTDSENEVNDNSGDEEIDLGKSMLKELREKLIARDDISNDLIDTLRDMLKPALVIDGQHRLFGAAKVEENIPLLVCSLVKPDWKEQVFQFTVINSKSVGIPKPFITSLAGMSLTPDELQALNDRLAQAGVQLWEVEVMQKMGYDPSSPFFGKINFNVSGAGGGLGYQTMKKVGKAWFEVKNDGLLEVIRGLYQRPDAKKYSQKSLKDQWRKNDLWFDYYSIFWGAIKNKFGNTSLWELHSTFMIAVVLEQLQTTFLEYLESVTSLTIAKINDADDSVRQEKIRAEFKQIVDSFVSKFEERHFSKPWAVNSLNHRDGKRLLADYFSKVFKGKAVHNHPLVSTAKATSE